MTTKNGIIECNSSTALKQSYGISIEGIEMVLSRFSVAFSKLSLFLRALCLVS
jgi:hypothetical protein